MGNHTRSEAWVRHRLLHEWHTCSPSAGLGCPPLKAAATCHQSIPQVAGEHTPAYHGWHLHSPSGSLKTSPPGLASPPPTLCHGVTVHNPRTKGLPSTLHHHWHLNTPPRGLRLGLPHQATTSTAGSHLHMWAWRLALSAHYRCHQHRCTPHGPRLLSYHYSCHASCPGDQEPA